MTSQKAAEIDDTGCLVYLSKNGDTFGKVDVRDKSIHYAEEVAENWENGILKEDNEHIKMTPQERADYKRKWLPGHEVIVHSDLRDHAKAWCKKHLEQHTYQIKQWTHVYAFTYCFESALHAEAFHIEFRNWVNLGI